MNIRFLETVIWLSKLKNFRATAEKMNMTPAAISSRVLAVEVEAGIRLFDRDSREVCLTQEGKIFIEGAQEIVARFEELLSVVNPATSKGGPIRIGVVPAMAITLLPIVMDMLKTQLPLTRVTISTGSSHSLANQLANRDIDIVLGLQPAQVDNLKVLPLCSFGMFWARDKTFSEKTSLTIDDLKSSPIISYDIGTRSHSYMIEYLGADFFSEGIRHYSNSLMTTIGMVRAGIGTSVLPPVVIQQELRAGTLYVLDVRPRFPRIDYCAMYLEDTTFRLAPSLLPLRLMQHHNSVLCSMIHLRSISGVSRC